MGALSISKMVLILLVQIMQIREVVGTESRELIRYRAQMEDRARREEELFMRAPLTKKEKKKEKHLMKSRNGYALSRLILCFLKQS